MAIKMKAAAEAVHEERRELHSQNQNQRHIAAVSAQSVAAFLASAMQEHALAVGCNEAIKKMWSQPCNGGEQHTETKMQRK